MNVRAAAVGMVLAVLLGIALLFLSRGRESVPTPQQDESACARKDEAACARRRDRMRKSCEAGQAVACVDLADAYYTPAYAPKDDRLAGQFFEKACALDDARGCFMLASLKTSGRIGAPDPASASTLEAKACRLGEPLACAAQAKCWERADEERGCPTRDPQKARDAHARLCELKKIADCEDAKRLDAEIKGMRSL